MKVSLRPRRDRIVIKRDTPEEYTAGGIIIPEVCKDPPITGEVLEVGDGPLNSEGEKLPMECQKGDHVIFPRYAGNNVTLKGETYIIIREEQILSKYTPNKETKISK